MPPKVKITKDAVIDCALNIVRESGASALNARAVAKKLNCSTQPIFSNYATMDALQKDIIQAATKHYHNLTEQEMQNSPYPPYKASGLAYIRFAEKERELFKLLFMRDRTGEEYGEDTELMNKIIPLVSEGTGMEKEDAYLFHIEMWIYVHGIATMIATSYLEWDWELIGKILTDAYQGLKKRYREEE